YVTILMGANDVCTSSPTTMTTVDTFQAVRDRNIAFNAVLQQECAAYVNCRFDDNAVFGFQFSRSHVSKLDYFHPSLSGQAALAQITWVRSWGS
ncbi:MAG: hypothetical protein ACRDPR_14345, partial [Nocardioidaceae bacterium]